MPKYDLYMLTLDNDIRNILEAVIENDLATHQYQKRVPKLKRIWKCQQALISFMGIE